MEVLGEGITEMVLEPTVWLSPSASCTVETKRLKTCVGDKGNWEYNI
jgi:hypothetical protein